jgi:cob(I)alamin adenosyltransferase
MLSKLTNYCNDLKINLKLPNNFVIPGNKTKSGAYVDFARTLARKCERKIVRLSKKDLKNEILLKWINLLSYCLWLLARKEESNVE